MSALQLPPALAVGAHVRVLPVVDEHGLDDEPRLAGREGEVVDVRGRSYNVLLDGEAITLRFLDDEVEQVEQ